MKQIGIIFLLVVSQGFGQWEYNINDAKRSIEAIGKIEFNVQLQDTILNLKKNIMFYLKFQGVKLKFYAL